MGRPKTDAAGQEVKRREIRNALRTMLIDAPASEINASQLIDAVSISRPTFYKWFPGGLEQAMSELISETYQPLREGLDASTADHDISIEEMAGRAVTAYFSWIRSLGPFSRCVFREVEVPGGPFADMRQQILLKLRNDVIALVEKKGVKRERYIGVEALTLTTVNLFRSNFMSSDAASVLDGSEQALRAMIMAGMRQLVPEHATQVAQDLATDTA